MNHSINPQLPASEFLEDAKAIPVVDSRSQSEFLLGHIPGAINIPLLDDEVRKQVGTAYKKQGREEAVELAFKLAGPGFHGFISEARKISPEKKLLVYCWRGGMRSATMAWVLGMAGFRVSILKGGYKAYRNLVLEQFKIPRKLIVLGGKTGSGKTEILEFLKKSGEQVINLEALASHKGSAFGGLGMQPQPSHQQFENELAREWCSLSPEKITWIENESRQVGVKIIPETVYAAMRTSPVIEIGMAKNLRAKRILEDYGKFPVEVLSEITLRLSKRLGPNHAKDAVEFLSKNNLNAWLDIVLGYYDKLYEYGTSLRNQNTIFKLPTDTFDPKENALLVLDFMKKNYKEIFDTNLKENIL